MRPRRHTGAGYSAHVCKISQHSVYIMANHGKPWDCKVMGTKVSNSAYAKAPRKALSRGKEKRDARRKRN